MTGTTMPLSIQLSGLATGLMLMMSACLFAATEVSNTSGTSSPPSSSSTLIPVSFSKSAMTSR